MYPIHHLTAVLVLHCSSADLQRTFYILNIRDSIICRSSSGSCFNLFLDKCDGGAIKHYFYQIERNCGGFHIDLMNYES